MPGTTPAANKVKYNLKNVHYAPITAWTAGAPTYGTPVAIPGAVSLSLEQQGEVSKFYADGTVYFQAKSNNGYEGDLEIAIVPDGFRQSVLGETLDATKKILIENAGATGSPFALLFEFEGDSLATKHALYNCTCTRPGISGKTSEETIEPDTETLTISAIPLPNGNVKICSTPETDSTTLNGWYTAVVMPSA